MELVVLERTQATAAGGAGPSALRLPSHGRAQPHASLRLRRRFWKDRPRLALHRLFPPGQALQHATNAQTNRRSSRRSHSHCIFSRLLSHLSLDSENLCNTETEKKKNLFIYCCCDMFRLQVLSIVSPTTASWEMHCFAGKGFLL